MSEAYYVKCEDCGRRLLGPARTCDVCGGKMTRSAEESYYTPEGIIKKSHYRKTATNTPGGEKRAARKPYSDSKSKTAQSIPLINRIGDAVDVLTGSDGLTMDSLKKMGGTIVGSESTKNGMPSVSNSNRYNHRQRNESERTKKLSFKHVLGVVIFVIMAIAFVVNFLDLANNEDYDTATNNDLYQINGEYIGSDEDYIYPYESVTGNGYTLSLNEIEYDENYSPEELTAYLSVSVTGSKEVKFDPYRSLSIQFDGESLGTMDSIYFYDEEDTENGFQSEGTTMTMKPGKDYTFSIVYSSVPDWKELKLIHNFFGTLSKRDTALDITVSKVV